MRKPHKHAEVIKAWAEGYEIQVMQKGSKQWIDAISPIVAWYEDYEYRIKPEPKYVPFTFEDAKYFIGKTVINKKSGSLHIITSLFKPSEEIRIRSTCYSLKAFLDDFTFLDGSPCGKLEE